MNENDPLKLPPGTSIYVCGTWSGWAHLEEMELTEDGIFTTTVILGNTRCESFYLCMNGNTASKIYPVVNEASPLISIKGPGDQGAGKSWLIDGRDREVPAGTAYKIYFNWGQSMKKVWWEEVSEANGPKAYEHVYSIIGSWASFQFQDLTPNPTDPTRWEGSFKVNERGECLFQLVRDHDNQQLIYPSKPDTTSTDVPVRGPDAWGAGKYWKVEGAADDIIQVQLEINDGSVEVTIGLQVWESIAGWGRHDYFLKTFGVSQCTQMTMAESGIFRCTGITSAQHSEDHHAYVESFQILVDEDPMHCFYPALADSASGANITCLPDGLEHEERWLVQSLRPGASFEVIFDTTATDRRKMVTWSLQ
mmetsp:Transcript_43448/g.75266  ORF Transcript_43448/g.75266 Transcript_43448/m.75266 type:complete len:364 (-) Transcript_43448:42-1133(-)